MDNRPIGIFDSGLGGLTAVRALKALLPHENIVYFGDTARVPYGTRSVDTIKKFAVSDLKFVNSLGVKAVLAACGTVSSVAMPELKKSGSVYISGVVEATAKKALESTRNGKIGVIGTSATVKSGSYVKYISEHDSKIETVAKACPLFVPLVENGHSSPDDPLVKLVVEEYLSEIKESGVDTVILGCTHYPILKAAIADYLGDSVVLVDSGREAALETAAYLKEHDMLSDSCKDGIIEYYVSDNVEGFAENAGVFLSEEISGNVKKADIDL